MKYKLEEKIFLSKAIISNVHSKLLKSRFNDNSNNEQLVNEATDLAVLMLEKRNLLFGESVKKRVQLPAVIEINYEEIIDIFNLYCTELPKVSKVTRERELLINKIFDKAFTAQDIGTVFKLTQESDYLSGRKADWKASFDWIMNPKNFIKILEGNYKNNENGKERQQRAVFGRQDANTFIANTTGWVDTD